MSSAFVISSTEYFSAPSTEIVFTLKKMVIITIAAAVSSRSSTARLKACSARLNFPGRRRRFLRGGAGAFLFSFMRVPPYLPWFSIARRISR